MAHTYYDMSDLAFIIFLGIVVWLAVEFMDGGGGSRQKLRLPC